MVPEEERADILIQVQHRMSEQQKFLAYATLIPDVDKERVANSFKISTSNQYASRMLQDMIKTTTTIDKVKAYKNMSDSWVKMHVAPALDFYSEKLSMEDFSKIFEQELSVIDVDEPWIDLTVKHSSKIYPKMLYHYLTNNVYDQEQANEIINKNVVRFDTRYCNKIAQNSALIGGKSLDYDTRLLLEMAGKEKDELVENMNNSPIEERFNIIKQNKKFLFDQDVFKIMNDVPAELKDEALEELKSNLEPSEVERIKERCFPKNMDEIRRLKEKKQFLEKQYELLDELRVANESFSSSGPKF